MKKLLCILGTLFCLWHIARAQPITIPASQFPIVSTISNEWRFIGVNTNGNTPGSHSSLTSSNFTATWGDMVSALSAIINPSFPWVIITNGSPASVVQAQFNALTNGGVVAYQPGPFDFTNDVSVSITNQLVVLGNGVTVHYPTGATNFMFDTGTNYGKPIVIDNLRFAGDTIVNYNQSNYFHLEPRGGTVLDVNPYFNANWANRSALRIEVSGGALIYNCYFYGWSGNGVVALSSRTSTQYQYPKLLFINNHVYTNFVGFLPVNSAEDVRAYYNNDISGQSAWLCEYVMLTGNDFFRNYIAVGAAPGNCVVDDNFIDENWIALWFGYSTGNGAHGRYNNNSFNHNNFAIWAARQPALGEFQNNFFGRNGQDLGPFGTNVIYPNGSTSGLHFEDCQGIMFCNNKLSIEWITMTNNCNGIFAHNTWGSFNYGANALSIVGDTNLVWGTTGVQTNIDNTVRVYDNWENLGQHDDYSSTHVNINTNANWPPTFYSLQAKSTNEIWMTPSNSVPPHLWIGHFDGASNVVFDGHIP